MKRTFCVVILAILLIGLILLGSSDTHIAIADIGIHGNEITSSQTEANNSSASATITITIYTVDNE